MKKGKRRLRSKKTLGRSGVIHEIWGGEGIRQTKISERSKSYYSLSGLIFFNKRNIRFKRKVKNSKTALR